MIAELVGLALGAAGLTAIGYKLGSDTRKHLVTSINPMLQPVADTHPHRYRIERKLGKRTWDLYKGSDPEVALRWVETVKRLRESGTMEFFDDGVSRDFYAGDAK